jgi:hypothetical protein
MRQSSISPKQEKFIKRMSDFLAEYPAASITVYPQQYAIKEKEYILFFEAKKKYFLLLKDDAKLLTKEDSEKVCKMSVKDSLFVHYLNRQIKDSMLFTIQDKCMELIHSDIVHAKFKQLNIERENAFLSFFKEDAVENRIKFSDPENTIPYNGFSFYKIEYKGVYPASLIKAYQELNELNDETPREKFKKERVKIQMDSK